MSSFLSREIYIRLSDDQAAFVCTVKRGHLYSKSTLFPLSGQVATEAEEAKPVTLVRNRSNHRSARETGQKPLGLEDEQAANE